MHRRWGAYSRSHAASRRGAGSGCTCPTYPILNAKIFALSCRNIIQVLVEPLLSVWFLGHPGWFDLASKILESVEFDLKTDLNETLGAPHGRRSAYHCSSFLSTLPSCRFKAGSKIFLACRYRILLYFYSKTQRIL